MYTCMVPYLKGIYLSLNFWRHGRDETGWKILKQHWGDAEALDGMPPWFVKRVSSLQCDVEALMLMTRRKEPQKVLLRARHPKALYMVGDTSGRSFGCCSWLQGSEVININFRTWTLWMTKDMSSN